MRLTDPGAMAARLGLPPEDAIALDAQTEP